MYLKQIKILQVFILLIFVSCGNNNPKGFFVAPENSKKISIKTIELDSIFFDVETSYSGIFKIHNDKLYFADKRSCLVYEFDRDGKMLSKNLGNGGGPLELNANNISFFVPLDNGNYFILGSSLDCHIHNETWSRLKISTMDNDNGNRTGMPTNITGIKGDEKWVYVPFLRNLVTREFDNFLYYNICAENPHFNPLTTSDNYYDNARIIAKLNLDNFKIDDIYGRMSPFYKQHKKFPQFAMISFDISDDGDFYVCYQADSTIYKYDKNYKILSSFGYQGLNMKLDYSEISTLKQARKQLRKEIEINGYYNWIEYIDERELLFRSYKKGINEQTDGLQIYKNNVLIADLDVPKGFKVSGYIEPYFYSDVIIDDENEMLKVYKFKL